MSGERARESLSALLDGEVGPSELSAVCAAWRQDGAARADWHAYALIGDVLRSEDLAVRPARDAAFLDGLRERLAHEPVVIAPQPRAAAQASDAANSDRAAGSDVAVGAVRVRRRRWAGPFAVAAGFVAVGGVLLAMRGEVPEAVAPVGLATTSPQAAGIELAADAGAVPRPPEEIVVVTGDGVLRDKRLDRYLEAHKQFAGSVPFAGPAGFVRSAAAEAPGR